MARLPRLNLPGVPQHLIQRGNNRTPCFYHEQDYAYYLDTLHKYSQKYNVDIHAYVLMTNHVHILLTPHNSKGVSQMMQSLGRCYVRYINTTYQRSGTLWEGRFKSSLIDSAKYFFTVCRYIEMNPVRAKMCLSPENYTWSSYQSNALGKSIHLLTHHALYNSLGNTESERQDRYRKLFEDSLKESEIQSIRESTNKGWVIGSDKFKVYIETQLGRRIQAGQHGGDRRSECFKSIDQ